MGVGCKRKLTGIEVGTDVVAEEEGDAATTLLVKGDLEGLRNRVLAGVVETGEKNNEALL